MDNKLTDNDIIKALECCIGDDCDSCPLNYLVNEDDNCYEIAKKNALDLINRQKAEIEELKQKRIEDDKLLNDRVVESVNAVSKAHLRYEKTLEERLKTIKSEAIKAYSDEVQKRCIESGIFPAVTKRIMQDVRKEMVGDNK